MLKKAYINKIVPYFPFLLFIVNIVLKFLFLTAAPIGHDEPFSIYYAQGSVSSLINVLKTGNNPPLFEVLLHFWIKLFGISPFSVRFLPAMFACICPVVLYYFTKRNFSLRVAIASSLLFTFSNLLLYYAHDCRVYSLFVLLGLMSSYYYLEVLNDDRRTLLKQGLFVLFSTLLIYAHYFGFIVLAVQIIHLLLVKRGVFLKTSINYFFVLVFYLPCILNVFTRFNDSVKGTWVEPPSGIESLYNMLWAFSNAPVVTVTCIAVLVFSLIKNVVTKAYKNVKEKSPVVLILIWFLVPFFGMFFISYYMPMYISRYLVFVLPAYYILLAYSFELLIKKVIYLNALLAILILCFAFTSNLNPDKKQPVFEAIKIIKQNKDYATLVVIGSYEIIPTIAYNYNRTYFSAIAAGKQYHLTDSLLRTDNLYCTYNPAEIEGLLNAKFTKVIYLGFDEKTNSTEYPILNRINSAYKLERQEELKGGNWKLWFYTLPKK